MMMKEKVTRIAPPQWADTLLEWYCSEQFLEEIQGDLHEWFYRRVEKQGPFLARILYFLDVIRFFRTFRLRSINNTNSTDMTGHNMKITWRSLRNDRMSSLLRIGNLTLGIACFLLILMYVNYERSYDRYHTKSDNIYRLQHSLLGDPWAATPTGVGAYALDNVPEITAMARFESVSRSWVKYEDRIFTEGGIFFADTSVFDVFDYKVVKGNAEDPLQLVNGAVITESMAIKYFGDRDPIGEVITLEQDRGRTRIVTAVIEDVPPQSHFTFDMLLPMHVLSDERLRAFRNWATYTYVVVSPEANLNSIGEKIVGEYRRRYNRSADNNDLTVQFTPLVDIHLFSNAEKEITANSRIEYIYILSFAAIFVLLISTINFANLTIVKGLSRGREVGVKKTLGALKRQLSNQFFFETFIIIAISSLLSLLIVYIALPLFRDFAGLAIPVSTILSPSLITPLLIVMVIISLVCGYVPARVFSAYKPSEIIKSSFSGEATRTRIGITRKSLIVLQFVISTVLIIGSITIYRQLTHLQNTNLGFDHDQVIVVPFNREMRESFAAFRQELLTYPAIDEVASSSHAPGYRIMVEGVSRIGTEEEMTTRILAVSPEFLAAYGIDLVDGTDFTASELEEGNWEIILNESAKKELFGEDFAVGKKVAWNNREGTVVGIASDFNFQSFHEEITPLVIFGDRNWIRYGAVRFKASSVNAALEAIDNTGEKVFQNLPPVEYEFLDSRFEQLYLAENRLQSIVMMFCAISILLTFSGIFGLAIFIAQGKTKEVAIRKVLGSPIANIISLMSRSFMLMAGISLLVSIPASIYLVRWWLSNFAYKVDGGPGIYLLAAISLLLVVFLSSGYINIRSALANPVDSLRSE